MNIFLICESEGFQSRKAMKVIPEEKMDKFDNKNLYKQMT